MDIEYNGKTYHVWTDGDGGIDRIFDDSIRSADLVHHFAGKSQAGA